MSFSAFCRPVEGCADEGQNVDGFPVYCGFKDIAGKVKVPVVNADGSLSFAAVAGTTVTANQGTANAGGANAWPVRLGDGTQFLDVVSFANVNSTLSPTITSVERVSSDINVQDASTSTTNRVRSAKDITPGVGGGAMFGVGVGLYDGANFQAARCESSSNPNLRVSIYQSASEAAVATPADAQVLSGAVYAKSINTFYNGASSDLARNNVDVTLLASASRTTTQTSADITTYNLRGINVILDMTVVGTGSVTVTIDGKDPASGKYYNLLTGAAVTTNSTNVYKIGEALTAVANATANDRLPRVIRIVVTANNANAATYSVGYTLLV